MSQGIAVNYTLDLYFPEFNLAAEFNVLKYYKYWNNDKEKKDHIFNFENMDFDIVERIDKIKHFYWVSN